MALMVETIKQRINKYGLSQAVVRPLGSNQIIVEIPRADSTAIKSIEDLLREQGHFQAIIDGGKRLTARTLFPALLVERRMSKLLKPAGL